MKIDIQGLRIIWFFFRSYKLQCLGVLIFMFFSGFLETMNLAALYPIINYGLSLEKKDVFLGNFEKIIKFLSPENPFLAACILLIIISILAFVFKFLYNYFSSALMIRIYGDAQKSIFNQFIAADYNFYVKNQQGKLIYTGTTAPDRLSMVIFSTIMFSYHSINALLLFSLLMVLSWQATLLILMAGLLYTMVTKQVTKKLIHKCAMVRTEQNQQKNIILNEFIAGIKSIKIFLAADEWKRRYMQVMDKELANQFRMLMGGTFPEAFVRFIFFIFLAVGGVFLSHRSHAEIMSMLPVFGIFVVVANRFLPSANAIGSAIMEIAKCLPDTRIIYDLCLQDFPKEKEGIQKITFKDKISFENVCFKYSPMTDYLLKDLSFAIERRKITAIVGLSGSGKTTIISLLLKLYPLDKGAIKIDGADISEINNKSYLSKIGYVSQETFIFNSSFKENIRFGMDNCTDQMIEEAAQLAHAEEFIKETPQGYDTIVGDAGIKLSGGQRQRIAIARAMLRKPEVIVLDEATSSLDNISEKKIQKAINNISKHATVLVIAHRLSTVQQADKIIILEKGEIKEQGTHEELMNNKKLYYDLQISKDVIEDELIRAKVEENS